MKKIIAFAFGLIGAISTTYATAPLVVTFKLSNAMLDVLAGNVALSNTQADQTVYGSIIDKITPSAKLSWNVPGQPKSVEPGIRYFVTTGYCSNVQLKTSGTATITFNTPNPYLTCTCVGSACE